MALLSDIFDFQEILLIIVSSKRSKREGIKKTNKRVKR
jgi:hypothetical protein